ncbi:MAG: transcriptional repressor [Chloroflexi bacterium]|nr:transcriptional repressor [Chloroflexota bacterium]
MERTTTDAVALLQQKGYRLTPQRLMVLEAVRDSAGHLCAEEICASVKARYPYANISTVYRTLELLRKLGLVTETDLGQGKLSYHFADHGRHHHLVCQECQGITDADDADLSPLVLQLLNRHGFQADVRHLAIFGKCRQCSGKGP